MRSLVAATLVIVLVGVLPTFDLRYSGLLSPKFQAPAPAHAN